MAAVPPSVPPSEALSSPPAVDNSKKPRYSVEEVLTIAAFLELYADEVRHLLYEKATKETASNSRSQPARKDNRTFFTSKGQFFNHIADVGKDANKLAQALSHRADRLAVLHQSRNGPSLQQFWTDVLLARHRLWSRQFIGLTGGVDPADATFEEWLRSNRNPEEVSDIMGRIGEYRKEFNGRQSWTWREFEPVMRAVDMICRDDPRVAMEDAISTDNPRSADRFLALVNKAANKKDKGRASKSSEAPDEAGTDAASAASSANKENDRPAKKAKLNASTTALVEALNSSTQSFWAGAAEVVKALAPVSPPAAPAVPAVTRVEVDALRAEFVGMRESVRHEMVSMRQDMASVMRDVMRDFMCTRDL